MVSTVKYNNENGDEKNGTLSLDSRKLAVDAPGVMREKMLFDLLTAQVGWERDGQGLEIVFGYQSQ